MASINPRARLAGYRGVLTAATPIVRRLANDRKLREDVRELFAMGSHLADRVREEKGGRRAQVLLTDSESSAQLARLIDAAEDAAQHLLHAADAERRHWSRRAMMAGALAGGIAALVVVPRSIPAVRGKAVSFVRPNSEGEHLGVAA
jgi:hypothetical protein